MPKIPQNYAEPSLRAGPVGPEASALAFNPSAGLEAVGRGIENAGESLNAIAEKQRMDDEYRWIVKSSHQYNLEAAQWEQDPANHTREDFGQATLDYLEKRKTEYLKNAPSARAAARLTAQLDNTIESRYHRAAATGEHTKLANSQLEIDRSISDAMSAYRADSSTAPEYAATNLEPQMDLLKESILTRWGKVAPMAANKFLEHIETQFVAGTAEQDPQYARKLLNEARFIDETKKVTLGNIIEANERAGNRLAQFNFHNALQEQVQFGWDTQRPVNDVALAQFQAVYGKDAGALEKAKFDQARAEANQAAAFVGRISGLNAQSIEAEFGKYVADPKISHDAKAKLSSTINTLVHQATADPHAYLTSHNLEVQKAYQYAGEIGTSDAMGRANKIALEYQGYAPDGIPDSEKAKYLNIPTNARHLMSREKAIKTTQEFAAGTREQQLAAISKVMAFYPEEQRAIAFNDLVLLPPEGKGVHRSMEWAFLHRDKTWVKDFIGAQQADAIKHLNDKAAKEFDDALKADKNWLQFQQTFLIDGAQRANEVAGYKEGLLNYSYLLSLKGAKTPQDAVREASNRLIDSAIVYPKINGLAVPVLRQRKDGSVTTNEEAKDLERRLNVAMETIPPEEVRTSDPNGRELFTIFPKEVGNLPQIEAMSSIIRRHGFFVTRPDGRGATVYLSDDSGVYFQITDKNGQPWEVDFDALPPFHRLYVERDAERGAAQPVVVGKEQPSGKQRGRGGFWKNQQYNVPAGGGMRPVP